MYMFVCIYNTCLCLYSNMYILYSAALKGRKNYRKLLSFIEVKYRNTHLVWAEGGGVF